MKYGLECYMRVYVALMFTLWKPIQKQVFPKNLVYRGANMIGFVRSCFTQSIDL